MAKTAVKTEAIQAEVEPGPPPFYKARKGVWKIAMWENRVDDTKGEDDRLYKTATLERGYTDKDGNWVNEKIRMNVREFGDAIALLQNGQQALITEE